LYPQFDRSHRDPLQNARRAYGWMFRVKGLATTISSLVLGLAGPFTLSIWSGLAAEQNLTFPPYLQLFVNHPWLITLVTLPALVCGIWLIVTPRLRWIMIIISTLSLLAGLAVVLGVMIPAIQDQYSYKPL
ncbi:MAG: hypothetical protein SGJ11_15540, partial [Phycisphaerae bacterium]|nr:hypothetical protein [Phycisphaerae bacterium]